MADSAAEGLHPCKACYCQGEHDYETERDSTRALSAALWIVIVVLVLNVLLAVLARSLGWTATAGEFGDVFGLSNAIISGGAFAVLIVTLNYQRRELGLQRRELELTRTVLSGQEQELRNQTRASLAQTEEARCMEIVNFHTRLVASLRFISNQAPVGFPAFDEWYRFAKGTYLNHSRGEGVTDADALTRGLQFFDKSDFADYGRYLASLKAVMRLIWNSQYADRVSYRDLLWSNMSIHERVMLYYAFAHRSEFADTTDGWNFVRFAFVQGVQPSDLFSADHESDYPLHKLQECRLEREN
jgi:hypothetical protein